MILSKTGVSFLVEQESNDLGEVVNAATESSKKGRTSIIEAFGLTDILPVGVQADILGYEGSMNGNVGQGEAYTVFTTVYEGVKMKKRQTPDGKVKIPDEFTLMAVEAHYGVKK